MTSLPSSFSGSSSSNVMDAFASYRRSQFLAAGNAVFSSPPDVEDTGHDEEAGLSNEEPADVPESSIDFHGSPVLPSRRVTLPIRTITTPYEGTPLLHKEISFSSTPHQRRTSTTREGDTISPDREAYYQSTEQPPPVRRHSSGSVMGTKLDYSSKSTFGQTLFNSIAVLVGIGMLSEPLAFSYAGWIGGTVLILFIGFISCYTAKILAHIILADPSIRSYADIGQKVFGPRSNVFISVLFCFEIFSVGVVLVTLYADSLHSIVPAYSANTYKAWGLVILIPTVFLPLSLLSYASVLGIIAILLIVAVIFIDGLSKPDSPGSLWSPAVTSMGVDNLSHLGISLGLFMAGFSGHAVIPVLSTNMINPEHFDQMINWAFAVATFIYAIIGAAGYVMFGNSVSDEISIDLLRTPGYNQALNQVALWMLVLSPLTKFALSTRPVNVLFEAMLGLDAGAPQISSEDQHKSARHPFSRFKSCYALKPVVIGVERVVMTLLAVGVSIAVPEFSAMMALLGSFSAFMLCIIGPVLAKVVLAGRVEAFDGVVLGLTSIMAVWGTVTAFWAMG